MRVAIEARARGLLNRLPERAQRRVRGLIPVRWGTFRRLAPIDSGYGYGRGTPIGRHYISEFVDRCRFDVRGDVLEVGAPTYAAAGSDRVTHLDIVDIDPYNAEATIVADLSDRASLPAGAFDCVILTQTLQYVADVDAALDNVWQALRPGGVALVSVPTLARRDVQLDDVDRWRFLPKGLETLIERTCRGAEIDIVPFGNVLVATASLQGLAAEELRPEELAAHDADYPTITCARVRKPLEPR